MMARTGRPPTHGMSFEPENRAWHHMLERCYAETAVNYHNYGGRGISVCLEWRASFERFFADMGRCPVGYSLDRIDVNEDYTPDNCRWTDRTTQANNTTRNVFIEWRGCVLSIAQWARELGLGYHTLYRRLVIKGENFPEAARPLYARKVL